ncbi:MAG: NAD(P)/FAD-dependent oxidoreductase [Acidimicrobiales bacterium]
MSRPSGSPGQTVVVLGGGVGGVVTANRLRRRLASRHRVVLVNREPDFSFAASYLWVMSGTRTARQVTRPLQALGRRGIEVVIGAVERIDPLRATVSIGARELAADHLVIALGAEYATDGVEGLGELGETFATLAGAESLQRRIRSLAHGRVLIVTAAPVYRCPAAPYESALLIDAALRRAGVRSRVVMAVHSAEPAPMGVAGANVSAAVTALLAERSIDYRPSHQITRVDEGRAEFADGSVEPFDLLVYMPAIRPPSVVAQSPLGESSGWVDVDRGTLATTFANVYAIGDNAQIPLSIGKPLPRAGVFAHAQGVVVADNIAAGIAGRPPVGRFDGRGGCFIETGFSQAGYGSGDFFAEPSPQVEVRPPSRRMHLGKVAFEFNVMHRWL